MIVDRLNAALSGRYVLERELGQGGMATVYVAQDVRHDRKVAIKVLRPELAAMLGGERFLGEIRTTANLQHPHILPLFDSGAADGFLFYVMPLLEGDSLQDRIERERQLPVDEAVGIAKAVASALDYAHRQGVIHRDIKPANILLQDGQPVVADYGIALAVSAAGGGRMTETGLSLGTPAYMSPEQATADRDPGPESDVYSLGCVLYEMLAGEPPFTGSSAQAILGKIVTSAPVLPTEHRPSVPEHVEAALLRALEKLPADRFRTAGDFGRALDDPTQRHARQTAGAGVDGGGPTTGAGWFVQRPSQVAVGLAVAALAWAAWVSLEPEDPPAPRPVTRVLLEEVDGWAFPVLSKDGQWLALLDSDWTLRLRRLDQESWRTIDVPLGTGVSVFSPDSRWAVLSGPGSGVRRISLDGGVVEQLVPASFTWASDWSESDRIVFIDPEATFVIPAAGGTPTKILDRSFLDIWTAVFVPGERFLIFDRGDYGGRFNLWVLDLESGEERLLVEDARGPQYGGGYVFFVRGNGGAYAAPVDERTGDLDGAPVAVMDSVTLGPDDFAYYSVSPAGSAVFLRGPPAVATQTRRVFTSVDPSGMEEPLPLPAGPIGPFTISSDGRRVAYQRGLQLWTYDPVAGRNEPWPRAGGFVALPTWSRDGSELAYGNVGAVVVDSTRPDAPSRRLLVEAGQSWFPQDWTPDGSALLIGTQPLGPEADMDLAVLTLGAEPEARPYLNGDWDESPARISPDGGWVAYASDETGEHRIYVRSFPDPGRRYDVSPAGVGNVQNASLDWAPDGSAIYWQAGDSVLATDVSLEPDFSAGSTRVLFRGDYGPIWDLAPDGRFLMTKEVEEPDTATEAASRRRLVLIVNWLEEVREKVRAAGGS